MGGLVLVLFGKSIGWLKPVFAHQPIGASKWMWIAPILIVVSIVLRLASSDYDAFSISSLVLLAITGACIGFAEELITRGYVIKMVRDAGKSEWTVMVLSSFLFGIMHSVNLLGGQSIGVTLAQLGFTFGFGICMYLTLRATGKLMYCMIIHGFYDPSLFISTGGINHVDDDKVSGLSATAGSFTIIFLIFALVAMIFVRGKVQPEQAQ